MIADSNSREETYLYNEEGYVIEERVRFGKREDVKKYHYEYDFYK